MQNIPACIRTRFFNNTTLINRILNQPYNTGSFGFFHQIIPEIKGFLEQRKMQKKTEQLNGHFIVCGYGRMGAQVARELRREHKPLVVIDRSDEVVHEAIAAGHLALQGDAENDIVLRAAGVERAYGLVAVLDTDAANLMVTVSARALNENLCIIARTNSEENDAKLIAAGAHRVLFPHGLGGRRMAQMAIRPTVASVTPPDTSTRGFRIACSRQKDPIRRTT